MLKNYLANYQKVVKEKKKFSKVISDNANRPKVLFDTIDSILNPQGMLWEKPHKRLVKNFYCFFTQKIERIRSEIVPLYSCSSINPALSNIFSNFEPVSSAQLADIVSKLNGGTVAAD